MPHGPLSDPALAHFWMPFTDNRAFKATPRMLVAARDMHYTRADGGQILDGTAGLWCVNAGHGRQRITRAIQAQAEQLDFAPTFNVGHPLPFELARRLSALMPVGMDRVFFTNSGSESTDTALKMALAYHRARGDAGRTRLIGRDRGYHGTNFGGTAVGGIGTNRRAFGAHLSGVDHIADTHDPAAAFTRGQRPSNQDQADTLERLVRRHGADTIAAVIIEPVAGSTGVLVPPRGYLEQLRQVCTRHGILLIFDEVITGFGRLGTATAAEYFGVCPDILTLAKGLTNGAVPMGAVVASRDVHDTIVAAAPPGIEFAHGYTYSGHPLAAAAAIAALDTYAEDGLFARAAGLSSAWENALHTLAAARHVIDVRNLGLIGGIELAPRAGAPGARAREVFHRCFDTGLLIRVTADIIALSPPLIIDTGQIEAIMVQIAAALAATD